MKEFAILGVFLLTNLVGLFCLVSPSAEFWRIHAICFFVIEAAFLVVAGVPIFLHHLIRKKRSVLESLTATVDTALEFLFGWV